MYLLSVRALLRLALALSAALALASHAADEFPNRYIKLIVPLAPGGGGDVVARIVAAKMSESLGQSVVVENQPGGSTIIGSNYVAQAKPDGYTLLLATSSNAINGSLYKLPFDPIKSFDGVSVIGTTPGILLVHPSVPAHNMQELIALARSKPQSINFASSGNASLPHLTGEMINKMAGIQMVHIPYKGGGPAEQDLLSGVVQVYLASPIQAMEHVKAGRTRAIAISSAKRSPAFPDIPAISETLPGFEAITFYVLLAPAGTPKPVLDKLSSAVVGAVKQADIAKRLSDMSVNIVGSSSTEAMDFMRDQIQRMDKAVKDANVKVDQ